MEKIINKQNIPYNRGKDSGFIAMLVLIFMSLSLNSCSAIGEIFKEGMSFGIFIVVAVIVVVVIIVLRFKNRKNS